MSAAAFWGIGTAFSKTITETVQLSPGPSEVVRRASSGASIAKVAAHAATGGVLTELQGGKFGHGFIAAGFTEVLSPAVGTIKGKDFGSILARTAISSAIGGTASKLSGGSFANGAQTGAFQQLFNDGIHAQHARVKDRPITSGESGLYKTVFGDSIPYDEITFSYVPEAGPEARTLGSHVTYRNNGYSYSQDFSASGMTDGQIQTFFHEGAHIWQGENYFLFKTRYATKYVFSLGNVRYEYSFNSKYKLDNYNWEQQAEIIGDYGLALTRGSSTILNNGNQVPISAYQQLLQRSKFP